MQRTRPIYHLNAYDSASFFIHSLFAFFLDFQTFQHFLPLLTVPLNRYPTTCKDIGAQSLLIASLNHSLTVNVSKWVVEIVTQPVNDKINEMGKFVVDFCAQPTAKLHTLQ